MEKIEVLSLTAMRTILQDEEDFHGLLTSEISHATTSGVVVQRLLIDSESSVRSWTTSSDTRNTRKVILRLGDTFQKLTTRQANRILERCYHFVELCAQPRVFLPHNWNSFQGPGDVFMFFAAQKGLVPTKPRWTAKRCNDNDVLFWDLYPADENRQVTDEIIDLSAYSRICEAWPQLIENTPRLLAGIAQDVDDQVILPVIHRSDVQRPRSFDEWMSDGQLAPDQKRFVLQDGQGSIRVKGPAGSGKTLALEVKAIREAIRLKEATDDGRILFATHSNAMQQQVLEDLYAMDNMGVIDCISVAPLLEIIRELRPPRDGLKILGSDYEEGLEWQLTILDDCWNEFISNTWVRFENSTSTYIRELINSWELEDLTRKQFKRDLIGEFSVVMGGEGIQIGPGERDRYMGLKRSIQWLPLATQADLQSVYEMYSVFLKRIRAENYVTTDQFMLGSLDWLRGFEWGTLRSSLGYDIMFVDELHLFSQIERTALNYLGRDPERYPRIYMSLDPRQSPTGRYGNFVEDKALVQDQDTVELREIFRYSPEILSLIQHIDRVVPTENFGDAWSVNLSMSQSRAESGATPTIVRKDFAVDAETTVAAQLAKNLQAVHDRVAIVLLDENVASEFLDFAERLAENLPNVFPIRDRDELNVATRSRRCLTVGLADHLAGLQFDAVIIAGIAESSAISRSENRKMQFASRLYLAVSRSSKVVQMILGRDHAEYPDLIKNALELGILTEA